ncbi:MAG TPA: hypothetical protein PKE20_00755 [Promineifilum sp.]|nr:hypothetical protein [Promineifilum sp.]
MSELSKREQLATLFQETWKAHHQAYADADGADPDWPIWYATHLQAPLGELLDARFTRSELVYLLITLDREVQRLAPGANWQAYYAKALMERYL